jgi:CHAT domain-containing protein
LSAIASFWSIRDDSTAVLMDAFYGALQKEMPKAEALRQAQLTLISDAQYSLPMYWPPFILIGNGL